jgi:hypothetical protein
MITGGKPKLTKGYGALAGDRLVAKFSGTANLSKKQLTYTDKGTLAHSRFVAQDEWAWAHQPAPAARKRPCNVLRRAQAG